MEFPPGNFQTPGMKWTSTHWEVNTGGGKKRVNFVIWFDKKAVNATFLQNREQNQGGGGWT